MFPILFPIFFNGGYGGVGGGQSGPPKPLLAVLLAAVLMLAIAIFFTFIGIYFGYPLGEWNGLAVCVEIVLCSLFIRVAMWFLDQAESNDSGFVTGVCVTSFFVTIMIGIGTVLCAFLFCVVGLPIFR